MDKNPRKRLRENGLQTDEDDEHVGVNGVIGSLRYGHYRLQTTVIHGKDLVRDLLRMLDSTWVL